LCCALAIFETDGRDPTTWVETRDLKLATTRYCGAGVQLERSLSVEHRHGGSQPAGDGVGGHRWGQPLHDHRQLDQAVWPTSTRPYGSTCSLPQTARRTPPIPSSSDRGYLLRPVDAT
jgi:hypothetical protein